MKRIVCFGDSNTWGFDPATMERHPADVRWTGVLAKELGRDYLVLEEGLNGRTTVFDDPIEGVEKNGLRYLEPCIKSHAPFDLIVIMLGTNDLKVRFGMGAFDIAAGAARLAEIVMKSECGIGGLPPKVLLVSPIHIHENIMYKPYGDMFGKDSYERSLGLSKFYSINRQLLGCEFLDASRFAYPSEVDSIHMDPDDHRKLGVAMAEKIRSILTV